MIDVSVVVSTRHRGEKIAATIRALLASDHPSFEVVVVDQSLDDLTEDALEEFSTDDRLRYVRSDTVGTGRSRQLGLGHARAGIVLYTDDDCLPDPNWITEMQRPFADQPRVGVVFCPVTPLVKEKAAGFTPSFEFTEDNTVTSLWDYYYRHGMGAGMGVRQATMDEIGGFDEQMGPGSAFMSGEDADIAIRSLIFGWHVHNTAQTQVTHDGLRPWDEYTSLARRDWFSLGGAYAKPLRCGVASVYFITCFQLFYRGLLEPLSGILRGERPRGFKRFLFLTQGLWAGLRHPLDRTHILYLDKGLTDTSPR